MSTTQLQRICEMGDPDHLRHFMWMHPKLDDFMVPDEGGPTPLQIACSQGHNEVVKIMLPNLSHESLIMTNNVEPRTPLHIACTNGSTLLARMLLERLNQEDLVITDWFLEDYYHRVSDLVVGSQRSMKWTPLHHACNNCEEQRDIVEMLLERLNRKQIVIADSLGRTPLHLACRQGHTGIVELIMRRLDDYDLDARGVGLSTLTPLDIACQEGHLKVVKLLMTRLYPRYPYDISVLPHWGPLKGAVNMGHHEVVRYLMAHVRVTPESAETIRQHGVFSFLRTMYVNPRGSILDKFYNDPIRMRADLRREFGLTTNDIAECFSLIVGQCDGYFEPLELRPEIDYAHDEFIPELDTVRFFKITCALPIELQMMICNRLYDCESDVIKDADINAAIVKMYDQ